MFNPGAAFNIYDTTGMTGMTLGSNTTNGNLSIQGGKFTGYTLGEGAGMNVNVLLNMGEFLIPNQSLTYISASVFTFIFNPKCRIHIFFHR